MDQPTREQLLHAEAAKYGIAPAVIDRAVSVIAAVQRRDRDDYRRNFGGELTPDQWLAAYGVSGFAKLCGRAARLVGLGDNGDLIMRIVSAVAPLPEQRDDDRPVQFWARPLVDPAEAASPAYRVTFEAKWANDPGTYCSGALLRQSLGAALTHHRGAASLEEATGTVIFTEGSVNGAFVARPAPKHAQPACSVCGQWAQEHGSNTASGSCPQFIAPAEHHTATSAQ
ncbi:hypothetical protein [Streptomyces asiaticus]|uniref:hypothetical protein n=1 Tax=Streptomyces asiaticus TaxID=114695 RepID=UPI003F67F0BA